MQAGKRSALLAAHPVLLSTQYSLPGRVALQPDQRESRLRSGPDANVFEDFIGDLREFLK